VAGKKSFFDQASVRVGLLLIFVLVIFATVMQASIPDSFGQYGRYRGDSIQENVNVQVSFAEGTGACTKCHDNIVTELNSAQHAKIDCQTCHGPGENHKNNPKGFSLKINGDKNLCASCHSTIAGRLDKEIVTVNPVMHSGGVICTMCHNPHQPLGGRNG
jgi:hypothetical protein